MCEAGVRLSKRGTRQVGAVAGKIGCVIQVENFADQGQPPALTKHKRTAQAQIERLKTDPHSPGQFRADGAAVNQAAFADAFALKPGDAMYRRPEDRISIW